MGDRNRHWRGTVWLNPINATAFSVEIMSFADAELPTSLIKKKKANKKQQTNKKPLSYTELSWNILNMKSSVWCEGSLENLLDYYISASLKNPLWFRWHHQWH